ncbi:MAG: FitA-like ribbon-helix-helix domain-containing protein [Steroidobacteraceae bacterium]
MTVNFSVKNVPETTAEALRSRARHNRRSLQQELLSILELAALESSATAISEPAAKAYASGAPKGKRGKVTAPSGQLSLKELWDRARRYGPSIGGESSTVLIRRDRDAR